MNNLWKWFTFICLWYLLFVWVWVHVCVCVSIAKCQSVQFRRFNWEDKILYDFSNIVFLFLLEFHVFLFEFHVKCWWWIPNKIYIEFICLIDWVCTRINADTSLPICVCFFFPFSGDNEQFDTLWWNVCGWFDKFWPQKLKRFWQFIQPEYNEMENGEKNTCSNWWMVVVGQYNRQTIFFSWIKPLKILHFSNHIHFAI